DGQLSTPKLALTLTVENADRTLFPACARSGQGLNPTEKPLTTTQSHTEMLGSLVDGTHGAVVHSAKVWLHSQAPSTSRALVSVCLWSELQAAAAGTMAAGSARPTEARRSSPRRVNRDSSESWAARSTRSRMACAPRAVTGRRLSSM